MPVNTAKLRSLMAGRSQTEVAAAIQSTQANISRILAGKSVPTLATLDKLARALGVRVGELLN